MTQIPASVRTDRTSQRRLKSKMNKERRKDIRRISSEKADTIAAAVLASSQSSSIKIPPKQRKRVKFKQEEAADKHNGWKRRRD